MNFQLKELSHCLILKTRRIFVSFFFAFVACHSPGKMHHSSVTKDSLVIKDYRVFYDGQDEGYNTIGGHFIFKEGGELIGVFTGGKVGDYETDKKPFLIRSNDTGKTWSKPELFAQSVLINPKESEKGGLGMSISGPTLKGTLLAIGNQLREGKEGSGKVADPQWRDNTLIIGRKENNAQKWAYNFYPSGTFLGEQFVGGGLQLPDGRLIFTIWGAKNKGENWRCGVLISDDDGISWKYRDVAYESDLNIRDKTDVSAGFNEQTVFLTKEGKLISIIRGRDKLGRLKDSPKDTWFFRSESTDEGESWSEYKLTNLAGTGATSIGLTLPDGSLLQACRIPYSRKMYQLKEPDLYGLHFTRSFDEGKTWKTEQLLQRAPGGKPFTNYYNAMNGQFLKLNDKEWLYIFGQFDSKEKVFRIVSCKIIASL